MLTILVLVGERFNPLCFKNSLIAGTASFSRYSLVGAVTMKSSAYRTSFTFGLSPRIFSIPLSAILHRIGDMTPPCGVPLSLSLIDPNSNIPAFSHFSIGRFVYSGVLSSIALCVIRSKHFSISASRIHRGDHSLSRTFLIRQIASSADRDFLNPNEFLSELSSTKGSSAWAIRACIARSFIFGIPSGLFSPFAFGIQTLFTGPGS